MCVALVIFVRDCGFPWRVLPRTSTVIFTSKPVTNVMFNVTFSESESWTLGPEEVCYPCLK
ncbi:hypothetical protein DPMN_135279 [Dreissena polymorpha]|uniref:Uncharacterized protein n=1 Tax=Dreissena polymorpha TaxID=45954 RepID=A0A9D4FXB1_DREPO|nr:hypothetical protein DPMN_135279 [Dreissena polymorpha]